MPRPHRARGGALQFPLLDYYVPRIIRSDAGQEFVGVVHEVIGPHSPIRLNPLAKIVVNATAVNRGHSVKRWHRDEGKLFLKCILPLRVRVPPVGSVIYIIIYIYILLPLLLFNGCPNSGLV